MLAALKQYNALFGTAWTGSLTFRANLQLGDLEAELERRASTNKVLMFTHDRALSAHLRSLQPSAPAPRKQPKGKSTVHFATVDRWDSQRAFGFLTAETDIPGIPPDRRVFCHRSNLPAGVDYLTPGMRVEFTLIPSRSREKPDQARIVRVIDERAAA
jgi:cold shock CspA family protein